MILPCHDPATSPSPPFLLISSLGCFAVSAARTRCRALPFPYPCYQRNPRLKRRGGRSAAGAVRGHALGLLGFIQAEKGGVDDFVFVDQGRASQRFASVTVVGAVADRWELIASSSLARTQENDNLFA